MSRLAAAVAFRAAETAVAGSLVVVVASLAAVAGQHLVACRCRNWVGML